MEIEPLYSAYTVDELLDAYDRIDREKYPDRFNRLAQEIERRKDEIEEHKAHRNGFERFFAYYPPAYEAGDRPLTPWRLKDVALGLLFLACLSVGWYLLTHSAYLRYRPWLAEPAVVALALIADAVIILFAVRVSRNHPRWPMISATFGTSWVVRECLKSLKYLLVVALLIMPVAVLFKQGMGLDTDTRQLEWVRSAPNSIYSLVLLVQSFTLGPVAEELFFRGFLYTALRRWLSGAWASAIQACVFSFVHQQNLFTSVVIFALGYALSLFYERRRNLLSPILLHTIKNGMVAVPLLVLTCANLHTAAATWEEARTPPGWLNRLQGVERQEDGARQWQYAIDTWGSKGSREWKKEANGFVAVCRWFPEERTACAKARLGVTSIYYSRLNDPRRAVVEADAILARYPDQKEQCAKALGLEGWAYYRLKDLRSARDAFERLRREFKDQRTAVEQGTEGIQYVDVLEKGRQEP
jgi:membrane protease YdiL (CAAX protease family)